MHEDGEDLGVGCKIFTLLNQLYLHLLAPRLLWGHHF